MYEIILIFLIAIVTLLTRAIPFLFFKDKTNQFIEFLGNVLPYTIMPMLVVYCLKSVDILHGNHGLCEIIAVGSVIILHLWKRNTLISVFSGTLIYMLCVQVLFI